MVQRLRLAVKEAAELSLEEGYDASFVTEVSWSTLRVCRSASSTPYTATLAKRKQTCDGQGPGDSATLAMRKQTCNG